MERLEELTAARFRRPLVDALRADYGETFLPLQRDVLDQTGLLSGREELLVSAPTASGKTLLAELACLRAVQGLRTALYLVPTRALAEQKAAEFARRYGPLGIRVVCTTRDRRERDREILDGAADWIVAVYEKALALASRQTSILANVGVVVADEIQVVGDAERGAGIDLFLTRWKCLAPRPRLVALSAVLGNAPQLAAWLGARLVTSSLRPAPLREGVLDVATGMFRWRNAQTGELGEECLVPMPDGDPTEIRLEALRALAEAHGPVLQFCATRRTAGRLAFAMAERTGFTPAERALEELAETEPGIARETLETLLARGMGLHTADLPGAHRAVVERAFDRGELRLLVATPTLEQGVNLSAATVVHEPMMVAEGVAAVGGAFVPLSRARFVNRGGRAGRQPGSIGRSIVLTEGEIEGDHVWRTLVAAPVESVRSPFGRAGAVLAVADCLAGGRSQDEDVIHAYLDATLAAAQLPGGELARLAVSAVHWGTEQGFWSRDPLGRLVASGLGEVLARGRVRPATLMTWREWLPDLTKSTSINTCLFPLLLAEEWEALPVPLDASERRRHLWIEALRPRLEGDPAGWGAIEERLAASGGIAAAWHAAARRAVILIDWLGGEPLCELELRHGLPAGRLGRMASQAAWMATVAADLAGVLRLGSPLVGRLEELGERLGELDRALAGSDPLAEASVRVLVPSSPTAAAGPVEEPAVVTEHPPSTLVFPAFDSGTVVFNGERFRLTPIQYGLLRLLAENAGSTVPSAAIHEGLWPDAAVEDQQVRYHRRRAERALGMNSGDLIETRRGWGLRLRLAPEQVLIEANPFAFAEPG